MELALSVRGIVETVTPVNTEQSKHRQEYSGAHTGRPLHLEGIEVLDVGPAVTSFEERKHIDT